MELVYHDLSRIDEVKAFIQNWEDSSDYIHCTTSGSTGIPKRIKLSKKQIEQLFMTGVSVGAFPLRMVYLKGSDQHLVGVSVSKKHFKNAVDRNRIKRLLRVAIEKQLSDKLDKMESKFSLMVLYVGKEMPESAQLKEQFEFLIKRFNKKQSNEKLS